MTSVLLRLSKVAARSATRSYASALFIPGSKATETFAFLSPYLDFDERFADLKKLQEDLDLRGAKINAEELAKTWQFYKYIDANKWSLEHRKNEIARRMRQMNKKEILSSEDEKEKIALTTLGKVIKQDMRMIKEALWEMEESVIVEALKLPNNVHDETPAIDPKVTRIVGKIDDKFSTKSHLEIGSKLGLIDYKNPMNCYLCNEASLFEIATLHYVGKCLLDENIIRITGTDFCRSLVAEACGIDHEDPSKIFLLTNNEGIDRDCCNRLHLVGGASLPSFLTMHTKQLINPKNFPLRYFAAGREYIPYNEDNVENGLFTLSQESKIHAFFMTRDAQSLEHAHEFDRLADIMTSIYDSLDVHYRVVVRSANELRACETLRISYEMWSAHSRRYIEIGHLSIYGRYLSKRLLIAYQTPIGRDFPAIISGTVMSVPKILGCLLEDDPTKLTIPKKIAEHML